MKRRDFLERTSSLAAGVGTWAIFGARCTSTEAPLLETTDVYVSGDGYHTYRIPCAITTRQGTVLAFCEGRSLQGDHAENDIVLRRSRDAGRTWETQQVVAEDGNNALANPLALVVGTTGRVLLMFQRYPSGFHEREVVPGHDGDRICRAFIIYSDDDGRSWSPFREITRSVKRPVDVTSIASGPGNGIQLRRGAHAGRLVAPFNQGPWGSWKVYCAYSDDEGRTWKYGDVASEASAGLGNEVQVVERVDGTVMMNARSFSGSRHRKVALSSDGGKSWSGLIDDVTLIEPECQGTILRYTDPLDGRRSRLLFANPGSQDGRTNGTIRLSYDEGKTWPVSKTIYDGSFAYSSLTALPDGTIGLLYERDDYAKITLARFNVAWLSDGQDRLRG